MKLGKFSLSGHSEKHPCGAGGYEQLSRSGDPASEGGAVLIVRADPHRNTWRKPDGGSGIRAESPRALPARKDGGELTFFNSYARDERIVIFSGSDIKKTCDRRRCRIVNAVTA